MVKENDMEDQVTVVYELDSGFRKEIEATDVTQAIEIAQDIYEQVYECAYAAAMVNGEVVREWSW